LVNENGVGGSDLGLLFAVCWQQLESYGLLFAVCWQQLESYGLKVA